MSSDPASNPVPQRQRRISDSPYLKPALGAVSVVVCLAVWQAAVGWFGVPHYVLPEPLGVWNALIDGLSGSVNNRGSFWYHLLDTFQTTVFGFLIALSAMAGYAAVATKVDGWQLVILFFAMLLGSSPVWALFEDTDARLAIIELRKQVDRLGKESQSGSDDNEQLRRALLDMQSQVDALKAELAQTKGAHDALAKDLADTQRALKDQAQGIEQRLRKFEPIKVTIDGVEVEVDPSEAKEYDQALAVFRKGDFATATTAFGDFVRRYARSPYLAQSLFWLGNAQYAVRDYKSAVSSFKQLIVVAPEHARVPESLLAMANCQFELKETAAARKTLGDLVKTYPGTEAASAAKERLSKLK